jgi:phenylacetate-CoA ligase
MYDWLVPRVVLPLVDRATGRRVTSRFRELRQWQWRSQDEREAITVARVRRLLDHAAAHVPYYGRRLRAAGVGSGDIRSLADLAHVPVTSKIDLVGAGLAETTAQNLPESRRRLITTSGSTGVVFRFHADLAAEDTRLATHLLALEWAGVGIWTPEVRVNSPFRDVAWIYGRPSRRAVLARRLLLGQRTYRVTAPRPTVADLEALIRRAGPGNFFMWGFSSLLALLGERVLHTGAALPGYPRVVVSRGERMTEVRRRTIHEAFRAPVINHWGCSEMADLAQSCPDVPSGLHVLTDRVLLRVVREDGRPAGPGERGRVLLTDLENHVMPFINYPIGDWVVVGPPCSCRRGLPVVAAIDGRDSEILRLPSGERVSGLTLEAYIRVACDISLLREYQFVQTAVDRLRLLAVSTPRFAGAPADSLRQGLEKLLGPGLTVEIVEVAEIAPEPSGKRLVVKSRIEAASPTSPDRPDLPRA